MPRDAYDPPEYQYVAYIDEAGDPGLSKVKPLDVNGSSEWLILSAVLIRRENEEKTGEWIHEIIASIPRFKARTLHFKNLNDRGKAAACELVARKPCRIFTLASNKKNMRGYINPFAARVSLDANWFYCWMTRVLLERVSHYVAARSLQENGKYQYVKLVYSNRGGLSYSQLKAYFELLKMKSVGGDLVLPLGDLRWECLDRRLVDILPHYMHAGLQLADIAASAFYKGCNIHDTRGCDPSFAKSLLPVVAKAKDKHQRILRSGYGLKLLPGITAAQLTAEQAALFRHYGYPTQWWDPTPSAPKPFSSASYRC